MKYILQVIASILEWGALLSFPLVLLGYNYRKYIKPTVMIATIMSLLSLFLRMTSLEVVIIVLFQMVILYILINYLYKANHLEGLVITSIGYGFYVFIQLIFFEISVFLFDFNYVQFFFTLDIKLLLQVITMSFIFAISYLIHYYKFQLNELRYYIKLPLLNTKYKNIIIINSFLTLVLICLVIFTMLADEFYYKYYLIVGVIITLFSMMLFHMFLHYQIQKKRLIENTKSFLDHQQQTMDIVHKVKEGYEVQLLAIQKLSQKNSIELVDNYISLNQPRIGNSSKGDKIDDLKDLDEMLYLFIINKRKLASLLGTKIRVTNNYKWELPTNFNQIQHLSNIMDVLILTLYKMPSSIDKTIDFQIGVINGNISFTISSNIDLHEEQSTTLKLLDSLLMFKEMNASIDSNFKPVNLTISCPIT